jgi:hypothetical protein
MLGEGEGVSSLPLAEMLTFCNLLIFMLGWEERMSLEENENIIHICIA